MNKISTVELLDLIRIDELQQLQNSFAYSHDVSSVITDRAGVSITGNSNFSRVCQLVGSTEKGTRKCRQSNIILGQRVAASLKPELMHCLSCGFLEASAPIIISGEHVATWHISRKAQGMERDRLRHYAEEIDLNPLVLLEAFEEYEGITERKFKEIMELLWLVASQISNRSYAAYKAETALKECLQLEKALRVQRNKLRRLASEFLLTEEKTKRAIALELHDTVGHSLVALKRNLHSSLKRYPHDPAIKKESEAVEDIIEQTRSLTFKLSTPILYDFGIAMALEALADEIFRPQGISFELTDNCPELRVKERYRVSLYRMLSELCYNILKHAEATTVKIIFHADRKNLIAEVTDNGKGFNYRRKVGGNGRGLGLFGIKERLEYLGGSIKVSSRIGRGARIKITIPAGEDEEGR